MRIWYNGNIWKNGKSNISLKEKLSNYLLEAVLQAMLAVCRGISLKQIFKLLIGGNTASNACSMQGYKNAK